MQLDSLLNKTIIVTQTRSSSKLTAKQKGGLVGLGLRRIGSVSTLQCTSSVLGMVKKLNHVIKIATK